MACFKPSPTRPVPEDTTMSLIKTWVALAAGLTALTAAAPALADITVGMSLPLTGPALGLGIQMQLPN